MDEWTDKLIAEVEVLAQPLFESEGIVLIDVEYRREPRGRILRVVVDKPGGVTIADCANVSSELGDLLDANLGVPGCYNMEVSSPGLDRPLTKPRHFHHFVGRQVVVKTTCPIDGKRDFKGKLKGLSDGVVTLDAEQEIIGLPYDKIAKARLDY